MRRAFYAATLILTCGAFSGVAIAQTDTQAPASSTKASHASKASATMPTDAEIADAKAKGLVWANEKTKVYHKDDAQYGKTKHGKFMTEADAQAAGYRLAKASPIGKKKGAASSAAPQQ
jgi:uncharacterized iron-regulated membrane protein